MVFKEELSLSKREQEQILELVDTIRKNRKKSDNRGTRLPLYHVYDEEVISTDDTDLADERVIKVFLSYWNEMRTYTLEEIQSGKLSKDLLLAKFLAKEVETSEFLTEVADYLHEYFSEDEVWIGGRMYLEKYVATFFSEQEAKEYMEKQAHNLRKPYLKIMTLGYSNTSTLWELLKLIDDGGIDFVAGN